MRVVAGCANIRNEKVGVIHVIPGVYFLLWQTRVPGGGQWCQRWREPIGMGLKKLDVFQSKQKEGSDHVKSDRTERGRGRGVAGLREAAKGVGCRIFSGQRTHTFIRYMHTKKQC